MKCQVQPRLSPEGDGYICDTCNRVWKLGEAPNCQIIAWKPISTYLPGHDPIKVLAWASFQVWPYCNSPEFVRPDPYWTEWKEWTVYHNGTRWKIGIEPFDCQVLRIRITHWMPRLEAPDDFDPAVYREEYHN